MTAPVTFGLTVLHDRWVASPAEGRRRLLTEIDAAGFHHVAVADHVTFGAGAGFDGFVSAASVLATHDRIGAYLSVYLLALRHPAPVARQIATLAELHPGRFVFGVGVGGDDRAEIEACGIDPGTRGRRTDEALVILRALLAGEAVTFAGEFFDLAGVQVLPAPEPPVPVVIGGRSAAAFRRAGRVGDGWLGIWMSPQRFAAAVEAVAEEADRAGRGPVDWKHGLSVWCGFGPDRASARRPLAAAMEGLYRTSFEAFERWCPYGTPEEVAEFLVPYVAAGSRTINLVAQAESTGAAMAGAAEVRAYLGAAAGDAIRV
jgi:alkanesulfonate monooxygenase SsuD/methylene tetrahydromethanopterin reductase-like flavin-dependent oxidoreductase (luciferase family)